MSFEVPAHDVMEQHRDIADQEHKAFWEQNGGSPRPEDYFPGFEAGWNAAAEALSGGDDIPGDDAGLDQWAKDRAGEHGLGEDAWEWIHGFIRGAKDCKQAGQQGAQEEEHHDEERKEDHEE